MIRDLKEKPFPSVPIIDEEDITRVVKVLKKGRLTSLYGSMVSEFENEVAKYYGVKHAIATSSGTTALHAAIEAAGIGPSDEVITTPVTFVATANAILHNNAIPVFADIDMKTYTISLESIREKISERTRAILAVHIYGHPCNMDAIMEVARKYNLIVIEDCAQAHGARYKGNKVGTFGSMGCFSLWEDKNIGVGEGGFVITNDDILAERLRSVINHYRPKVSPFPEVPSWNIFVGIGYNYRMTEMQGALGIGQIRKLDKFNGQRRAIANFYLKELNDVPGLILPYQSPDVQHSWYRFVCRIDNGLINISVNEMINAINEEFGLSSDTPLLSKVAGRNVMPLHLQPFFANLKGYGKSKCPFTCPLYRGKVGYEKGMYPNAEKFYETCFTLFINHAMSLDDAKDVAEGIKLVFSKIKK